MVNDLWPTLTIAAAILFNRQRASLLIFPGFLLSMPGIGWILGDDQGFDMPDMWRNVQANPLSYGLAFAGAVIWAGYCTVTARIANGKNAVTPFHPGGHRAVAAVSGHGCPSPGRPAARWRWPVPPWGWATLRGTWASCAATSRCWPAPRLVLIPVFSAALAALILRTALPLTFWQGALLVCVGSTHSVLAGNT